jgi:hypothetical protein
VLELTVEAGDFFIIFFFKFGNLKNQQKSLVFGHFGKETWC